MNSIASNTLSDEHVVLFFRKLKSELNCTSTLRIIEQVRLTLSRIKNFSSPDIARKIPPLFHLMLANAKSASNENKVNHLDELAESLYKEDKQAGKKLFKSEIDALGIAIVILKHTQELFTRSGIQPLPYVLSTELKQAVIEEAV
jgi:hypothetical protein